MAQSQLVLISVEADLATLCGRYDGTRLRPVVEGSVAPFRIPSLVVVVVAGLLVATIVLLRIFRVQVLAAIVVILFVVVVALLRASVVVLLTIKVRLAPFVIGRLLL